MKRKNKAQSFLEYSVVIIVVAAALIAMRIYFVRAVQEKYRQSADVFGEGEQYAQGITQSTETNSQDPGPVEPDNPRDTCPNILAMVNTLQNEINGYNIPVGCQPPNCEHIDGLLEVASKYEAEAVNLDGQIAILMQQGMNTQAIPLRESARILREEAVYLRNKAVTKQAQIENLREIRPECF